MNSFDQIYNDKTFKFTLDLTRSFPIFKILIFTNNFCTYKSKEIIISKNVIQEMIELFKYGSILFDDVSRFEFRDPDKSSLIFIKSNTAVIGQTYNMISGKREEFVVTEIDKKKFGDYLESEIIKH